jgi:Fe-S-cluster containining protein
VDPAGPVKTGTRRALRVLHELHELHGEIDALATDLARAHADRLHCKRGCASCCIDDLTVLPVEAARISAAHAELLATGQPHAVGACAFLDAEGACRIYEDRPYVCRTQGLPLRWLEEDEHDEIVEQRDICPLNLAGPPLDEIAEDAFWLIGPFEERLLDLEEDEGRARVSLRELFRNSAG